MEIRRPTEQDAEASWRFRLTALETDPWSFGEAAEEFRETKVEECAARLRSGGPNSFVFGAFEGAELAGVTGFYREQQLKQRHKGWIWGVFVSPAARGKGVGRALLTRTLEEARALAGVISIRLTVAMSQEPARRLYQVLGFRSLGVEPRALKIGNQYVDEEHMILELEGPVTVAQIRAGSP
jgi:ribosomal protein S18 acetylase RimI-like enzyme